MKCGLVMRWFHKMSRREIVSGEAEHHTERLWGVIADAMENPHRHKE
jgi:hypothetical protein